MSIALWVTFGYSYAQVDSNDVAKVMSVLRQFACVRTGGKSADTTGFTVFPPNSSLLRFEPSIKICS